MDRNQFFRALWRQKLIVIFGVLVAIVATVLAGYRISSDGRLTSRVQPTYQSSERILVANTSIYRAQTDRDPKGPAISSGPEPAQLTSLYAYLVTGDELSARIRQDLGVPDSAYTLIAYRRTSPPEDSGDISLVQDNNLPILEIDATAKSSGLARQAARVAGDDLISYINQQQDAQQIPPDERVALTVTQAANVPTSTGKSPLILEAVVFFGVWMAFLGLAVARYNARTRFESGFLPSSVGDSAPHPIEREVEREVDIRDPQPVVLPTQPDQLTRSAQPTQSAQVPSTDSVSPTDAASLTETSVPATSQVRHVLRRLLSR